MTFTYGQFSVKKLSHNTFSLNMDNFKLKICQVFNMITKKKLTTRLLQTCWGNPKSENRNTLARIFSEPELHSTSILPESESPNLYLTCLLELTGLKTVNSIN